MKTLELWLTVIETTDTHPSSNHDMNLKISVCEFFFKLISWFPIVPMKCMMVFHEKSMFFLCIILRVPSLPSRTLKMQGLWFPMSSNQYFPYVSPYVFLPFLQKAQNIRCFLPSHTNAFSMILHTLHNFQWVHLTMHEFPEVHIKTRDFSCMVSHDFACKSKFFPPHYINQIHKFQNKW